MKDNKGMRLVIMIALATAMSFVLLQNWLFFSVFLVLGMVATIIINVTAGYLLVNPLLVFVVEYLLLLSVVFILFFMSGRLVSR